MRCKQCEKEILGIGKPVLAPVLLAFLVLGGGVYAQTLVRLTLGYKYVDGWVVAALSLGVAALLVRLGLVRRKCPRCSSTKMFDAEAEEAVLTYERLSSRKTESVEQPAKPESELRAEIAQRLRPDIEAELRVEIAQRLRPDIEAELRIEIAQRVMSDIEAEVRSEIAAEAKEARAELEKELRSEIEKQLRANMEKQLRSELERQRGTHDQELRKKIEAELRPEIERKLRSTVEAELLPSLERALRLEYQHEARPEMERAFGKLAIAAPLAAPKGAESSPIGAPPSTVDTKLLWRSPSPQVSAGRPLARPGAKAPLATPAQAGTKASIPPIVAPAVATEAGAPATQPAVAKAEAGAPGAGPAEAGLGVHERAQRRARVIVSDLALYDKATLIKAAHAADSRLELGSLWKEAVRSYNQAVPSAICSTTNYLGEELDRCLAKLR